MDIAELVKVAHREVGLKKEPISACVNCDEFKKPHYRIKLKPGGNRIVTPLDIPAFPKKAAVSSVDGGIYGIAAESNDDTKVNRETIDFVVENSASRADALTIEVLDGGTVIYSTTDTAALLPPKTEHLWQWDGYDNAGVLDTRVLKSKNLTVRLTATQGKNQQVAELRLQGWANKVVWADVRIDRNAKTAEVTVRPRFADGGEAGKDPYQLKSARVPYLDLARMAKEGIEKYWSRDGSRPNNIGVPVNTPKGTYAVKVVANVSHNPRDKDTATTLKLVELYEPEPGMSQRSNTISNVVYHNIGVHYHALAKRALPTTPHPDQTILNQTLPDANGQFERTAAHEFGHFILNIYAPDGGKFPEYSSTHKGTSSSMQNQLEGNPYPQTGEVDLMKYYSTRLQTLQDHWNRSVAAEDDVKGLLWIARVAFK